MLRANDPKLTASRVARRAIVYVRQSSQRQVEHNTESRELQYALADRARELGWKCVDVIDEDLGSSAGFGAAKRDGFERLLAAVALGEVGLVISREASRLSRTDRDWCRLLEICQIFDTLIGDGEQLYDLASLDDQLVLGIKGTLSVVELKVLRQRLLAGVYHKASKGDLHRTLSPGYVLDATGRLVKDPNERVQQAIALVFAKFREIGSIRQTFKWFHDHRVDIPVNEFRGKARIVFRLPTVSVLNNVLHNPVYAGAYVYGRRSVETRVIDGALKKRQGAAVAPEESRVFLRDHHEAYIEWSVYEENLRVMSGNTRRYEPDEGPGLARGGQGLLAGVLRCARCGRKLHVRYSGKNGTGARYLCQGDYDSGGTRCLGFGASTADRRVAEEVLRVLAPLGIEASIAATRLLESAHDARRALLEKQLEQVEYESRRAFEQYDLVDARNRLVAATLEARWNEKLREVDALKGRMAQVDGAARALSDLERAELRALGAHFRDVWESPSCTPEVKKKIVRTVVEEIIANEEPVGTLCFIVHWKGGAHTRFEMHKPMAGTESRTTDGDLDIIRRMAVRYGDDQITNVLNRLGRRTATGMRWNVLRVATARRDHGIAGQARAKRDHDLLTLNAAADETRTSDTTIRRLVEAGILPCEQVAPRAPWEIRRADLDAEPVRGILERLRRTGKLDLGRGAAEGQRSLFTEKPSET